MSINISVSARLQEPFYRYRRSVISIETKKNKTYVTNIPDIAKQLRVSLDSLQTSFLKRIKKKLSVSGTISDGKIIISGTWSVPDFESILQDIIEKHVLCPVCKLPELTESKCNACGSRID